MIRKSAHEDLRESRVLLHDDAAVVVAAVEDGGVGDAVGSRGDDDAVVNGGAVVGSRGDAVVFTLLMRVRVVQRF